MEYIPSRSAYVFLGGAYGFYTGCKKWTYSMLQSAGILATTLSASRAGSFNTDLGIEPYQETLTLL